MIIVKVQTALNDPALPSLVYDRERSLMLHVPAAQVAKRMQGRPKVYFYAELKDGQLALANEAPAQEW